MGSCGNSTVCFTDTLCLDRPSLLICSLIAFIIGVIGWIKFRKNLTSNSRNMYKILWITFGTMMSISGILHCIIKDSPQKGEASFWATLRFIFSVLNVGFTSSIGYGFGIVGIIDLTGWSLLVIFYFIGKAVLLSLWIYAFIEKKNWSLYLYVGPIVVGCSIYLLSEIILYIKYNPSRTVIYPKGTKGYQDKWNAVSELRKDNSGTRLILKKKSNIPNDSTEEFKTIYGYEANPTSGSYQQQQQSSYYANYQNDSYNRVNQEQYTVPSYSSSTTYSQEYVPIYTPSTSQNTFPNVYPSHPSTQSSTHSHILPSPYYYQSNTYQHPYSYQETNSNNYQKANILSDQPQIKQFVKDEDPYIKLSGASRFPGILYFLIGGLSGVLGLLFFIPLAKYWCSFLGQELATWFGPDFMWFFFSDLAMLSLLLFVLKSDIVRRHPKPNIQGQLIAI